MKEIIKVIEFCQIALSEEKGIVFRNKIVESLKKAEEVVLDFEGIKIFATPFFNSSIGYLVMQITPSVYDKRIKVNNLSDLGMETYLHSKENAEQIYQKKINIETLGEIAKDTIESN